jgi:hypothetical protein
VIAKIQAGTVTLAELQGAGAVQRGVASDDYPLATCPDTGNGCVTLYAVSIPGVTPSRFLTWFQATATARNAGKRLPTNAEWQAAALGTPDGAPCIVNAASPRLTGTAGCVSDVGVFDMVGNLSEWVADWMLPATACSTPLFGTGDDNCMSTDTNALGPPGPSALQRGGSNINGSGAGVFAVDGTPSGFAPPARRDPDEPAPLARRRRPPTSHPGLLDPWPGAAVMPMRVEHLRPHGWQPGRTLQIPGWCGCSTGPVSHLSRSSRIRLLRGLHHLRAVH